MLQDSVSNVMSLLLLLSEDRNTSVFLFMTVSPEFHAFYLIVTLPQYFVQN